MDEDADRAIFYVALSATTAMHARPNSMCGTGAEQWKFTTQTNGVWQFDLVEAWPILTKLPEKKFLADMQPDPFTQGRRSRVENPLEVPDTSLSLLQRTLSLAIKAWPHSLTILPY